MPHPRVTFTLLVFSLRSPTNTLVEGRNSRADVHEGDRGPFKNFWAGVSVGFTNAIYYSGCGACENALDFLVNNEDYDDDDDRDDDGLAPTTVKIVGVGLGRTGSTSLAMAFDILGHHPYHDDELDRVAMPRDFGDGNLADRERAWLDHFDRVGQAGFDVSFRAPLDVALKKGVKVILTVRDDAGAYAASWASRTAHGPPLATDNLLEDTDGLRRPGPEVEGGGGAIHHSDPSMRQY